MKTGRIHEAFPAWYSDYECRTDVDIPGVTDILTFHQALRGYTGKPFELLGDVEPTSDPHDFYMEVIRVEDWPPMKAYLEGKSTL